MDLVEATVGDGILPFEHVNGAAFMPYWKNLCIMKYVPDADDFRYRLWGTRLVELYERELTGRMMADVYSGERYIDFKGLDSLVLENRRTVCASGSLDWQERGHRSLHMAVMPLERGGRVNETLSYIVFG